MRCVVVLVIVSRRLQYSSAVADLPILTSQIERLAPQAHRALPQLIGAIATSGNGSLACSSGHEACGARAGRDAADRARPSCASMANAPEPCQPKQAMLPMQGKN
ncbi:hypothetical protein EVAR_101062_1 [Eumeta japonica]|uniref:Uncharacterized protein n=1 Tax=Eumeta variegata TaxID=151549 RepID=A0A4C2AB82_EUMVA|nr:hypothetical protein EVAR_101062_1 [Eumeta japonica]